jgi:predicted nucleic acid-binding protein
MITAVDTSVLLDVLLNDPQHASASMAALRQASSEGQLVLCEATLAELVPVLPTPDLPEFLADWKLAFVPSTRDTAILAGEMFRTYLSRGGKRGRVVPDFLIAAHAQHAAGRLLARDRGYYRDYFRQLILWDPSGKKLTAG